MLDGSLMLQVNLPVVDQYNSFVKWQICYGREDQGYRWVKTSWQPFTCKCQILWQVDCKWFCLLDCIVVINLVISLLLTFTSQMHWWFIKVNKGNCDSVKMFGLKKHIFLWFYLCFLLSFNWEGNQTRLHFQTRWSLPWILHFMASS